MPGFLDKEPRHPCANRNPPRMPSPLLPRASVRRLPHRRKPVLPPPYLPSHLMIRDKEAIGALYEGNSTLYRWDHIQPWLAPLGWWTLFVMLVVWTMLCLTALFRRQWDAERLNYPIAEIPIQIITQP